MDIILTIHSINRWIIVAVAVVAAVKFAIGWIGNRSYQPVDRMLMLGLTILMDLQLLLGIILLVGLGLVRYQIEHAVAMVIAVAILHLSARWRKAADTIKFRNNLLAIIFSIIIIILGVSLLPQGWF